MPWSQIHLILGIFVPVLLVIKLVRLTDSLGYGAYSAILAGILVAYGGYRISVGTEHSGLRTLPAGGRAACCIG